MATEITPLGYPAGFIAAFDLNRQGEVAYISGNDNGQGVFLKRSGKTYVVLSTARPTDE